MSFVVELRSHDILLVNEALDAVILAHILDCTVELDALILVKLMHVDVHHRLLLDVIGQRMLLTKQSLELLIAFLVEEVGVLEVDLSHKRTTIGIVGVDRSISLEVGREIGGLRLLTELNLLGFHLGFQPLDSCDANTNGVDEL